MASRARGFGMTVDQLTAEHIRMQWVAVTNTQPPRYISRSLLMRMLADRLQSAQYGGLSAATKRRLLKIANGEKAATNRITPAARLRPGSVLVRDWQGARHQVMVVDGGFAFEGRTYGSLSEVARLITGTRWSGPAFFGLRAPSKTKDTSAPEAIA